MNKVCLSVSHLFDECHKDIKERTQEKIAIYGTASMSQTLITEEGLGVNPILSGNIIKETPTTITTFKYGTDRQGCCYTIKNDLKLEDFYTATKDDLYLFVTMAHPKMLQYGALKSIIFNRLSQIYNEELELAGENANEIKMKQEIEKQQFEYIYDSISKAVKGRGYEVYYAEGYEPENLMER